MTGGKLDLPRLFEERETERGSLHTRYLNEQLVRVLKTIGFDVGFTRGQGAYLYDRSDQRYLDLLSGFGPLLRRCTAEPFNDLVALEKALANRQQAAFVCEPIQGKGVKLPDAHVLPQAPALGRQWGPLLGADVIQTGMGRTGKFLAVE